MAVALAMDALTVAVATGFALKTVSLRQTFRLAWHFGLFQALMPIAGWGLGVSVYAFVRAVDHWAAFALLSLVGGRMIYGTLRRSNGRTVRKDPTRGGSLVMLAVATSIDAFAVGFSLSMLQASIWLPAAIIGITAFIFTAAGMHIGRFAGGSSRVERYAEAAGGVVLIGIGIAILREHGVFL